MTISPQHGATPAEGLELKWFGAIGPCADMSLNNQSVVAGTLLQVRMRQLRTITGHRPDGIFIFQRPERRIAAAIKRLGMMHNALLLDHLVLKEDGDGWVSDDWPLKAPLKVKGRLEVFCSTDENGDHRGPSLTSVAFKEQTVRDVRRGPTVRGGLDFAGIGSSIEIGPQSQGYVEFVARAAVDPAVVVDVLVPGDGNFEVFLHEYLGAVAQDIGLKSGELQEQFTALNQQYLSDSAAKNLEFEVEPREFDLNPGEARPVRVSVRRYGGGPTLVAVRMTDVETHVQCVSDFIVVADGTEMETLAGMDDGPGGDISITKAK